MVNYALGVLGIVVSILLSLIGYRNTIGAKRERVAAANSQLEAILIRRVVLEKHTPSQIELARLIEGKARDHNIRTEDLVSEGQLLNTIFTRVTESDLIPAEQRDEILQRVAPTLTRYEAGEANGEVDLSSYEGLRTRLDTLKSFVPFAVASAIVGGFVAVILSRFHSPTPQAHPSQAISLGMATAVASLALISVTFTFFRLRASQEEISSKRTEISTYLEFENQVGRTIKKSAAKLLAKVSFADSLFDFMIDFNGRRIGIEAKAWTEPLPRDVVKESFRRISLAREQAKADEAIVVTRAYTPPASENGDPKLKIMTIRELRAYLR